MQEIPKTRHVISVVISETVDMSLPDDNGSTVAVEHHRVVREADTDEGSREKLGTDDLLDVVANLAVGTILQSDKEAEHKFQNAVTLAKSIISEVAMGIKPHNDLVNSFKGELTDKQQAALDLSVSAPSFKLPVS